MKIIIKNSTVDFKRRSAVLLNETITYASTGWKYFPLSSGVANRESVKTKMSLGEGVVLTGAQVKPYDGSAILNSPVFLANSYNTDVTATNYSGSTVEQVGVYVKADTYPVTVTVTMELVME